MNKNYNVLGYQIMQILARYASCGFPMSYISLLSKLEAEYDVSPAMNTLSWTLRDLNKLAHADIQGVGTRGGLWLTEEATETQVEALFAPIMTADYLTENCVEKFEKLLTRLRKKGPYQGFKQCEPRYPRQRLKDFLRTLETINEARLNRQQLGFTYNDLDTDGQFKPRCKPSHPDGVIVISVYKFFSKNNYYYIVGKREGENFLRNYRIDKMTKLFNTSLKAEPISNISGYENYEELNLSKYLKGNYKMFNGPKIECIFRLRNYSPETRTYYVNIVWDELGNNNLKWLEEKDGCIRFSARLPGTGALLFTKQFGDFVELLAPADLRQKMREYHKRKEIEYREKSKN